MRPSVFFCDKEYSNGVSSGESTLFSIRLRPLEFDFERKRFVIRIKIL